MTSNEKGNENEDEDENGSENGAEDEDAQKHRQKAEVAKIRTAEIGKRKPLEKSLTQINVRSFVVEYVHVSAAAATQRVDSRAPESFGSVESPAVKFKQNDAFVLRSNCEHEHTPVSRSVKRAC